MNANDNNKVGKAGGRVGGGVEGALLRLADRRLRYGEAAAGQVLLVLLSLAIDIIIVSISITLISVGTIYHYY